MAPVSHPVMAIRQVPDVADGATADLQPHALTPTPPSSGQATTIWVPHDPGIALPSDAITQARRK